jgi:hypothetical protein
MSTLIFIAGCAAGMAFSIIALSVTLSLGRRLSGESRAESAKVQSLLTEANYERARTSSALNAIANSLADQLELNARK